MVGAGADDLIGSRSADVPRPGRRAQLREPTYALYAIATRLEGADVVDAPAAADLLWVCNPDNPTGEARPGDRRRARPGASRGGGGRRRGVRRVRAGLERPAAARRAAERRRAAHVVEGVRLRRAAGFAVASREVAAELDRRRAPAPVSAPAARIAAAALREPRLDVESTVAERERVRAALSVAAGHDCLPSGANFVFVRTPTAKELADRLESEGLVVRRFAEGIRCDRARSGEDDALLRVLGAEAPAANGRRSATIVRTTAETRSARPSTSTARVGRALRRRSASSTTC